MSKQTPANPVTNDGLAERVGIEPTKPLLEASTVLKTAAATRHASLSAPNLAGRARKSKPRATLRALVGAPDGR